MITKIFVIRAVSADYSTDEKLFPGIALETSDDEIEIARFKTYAESKQFIDEHPATIIRNEDIVTLTEYWIEEMDYNGDDFIDYCYWDLSVFPANY